MNWRTIAGSGIVCLTLIASVLTAPSLPEQLTTHWNATGAGDGSMPKLAVLVGGPALVFLMVGMFEIIPRIDPLGENIAEFEDAYDAMAVIVAGFLGYSYGAVLLWNLGYSFEMTQALSPAVAVLFVVVGFLMERAERNWFVGIRTPWTLSSDAVWRHTHDRAAPLFKIAGLIALVGVVAPQYFTVAVVVPAVSIALFTTVYSYVDYQRLDNGNSVS